MLSISILPVLPSLKWGTMVGCNAGAAGDGEHAGGQHSQPCRAPSYSGRAMLSALAICPVKLGGGQPQLRLCWDGDVTGLLSPFLSSCREVGRTGNAGVFPPGAAGSVGAGWQCAGSQVFSLRRLGRLHHGGQCKARR